VAPHRTFLVNISSTPQFFISNNINMSAQPSSNEQSSAAFPAEKGKGKSAVPEESDVSMMDEDEDEEDSEPEAAVSATRRG
jgi:hypothetical protein